jgi:hypothetical protein
MQQLRKPVSIRPDDTAVLAVLCSVSDDDRMHFGAVMWIGVGAAALVIGGVMLLWRKPSDGFGAVSEQWVMQHRTGPPDDSHR